jgi:DNA ligase-1
VAKYIIKIVTGDLRIGLKESLVEEAIAQAFARVPEEVRRAHMLTGDMGTTLRLAAAGELASARLRLFHPIGFMLASPAETPAEVMENFPTGVLVEDKYDGIRAQAHKSGQTVKLFSRTLDEIVEFPELLAPLAALPGEFILDGEIVAWRGDHPLPFSDLQKRLGRKQPHLWLLEKIPVSYVALTFLTGRQSCCSIGRSSRDAWPSTNSWQMRKRLSFVWLGPRVASPPRRSKLLFLGRSSAGRKESWPRLPIRPTLRAAEAASG